MRPGGSKAKGNKFENEILHALRKLGLDAHKCLGSGNSVVDKGDLVCGDWLIECKHHAKFSCHEISIFWMKILTEARGKSKEPLLVLKENHREALIMMNDAVYGVKFIYWKDFKKRLMEVET